MSLSNRLKQVMDAQNITQEQLARTTGISQVSIQRVLSGTTKDPKFILEIGRALNIDPYWLKFGKNAPAFNAVDAPGEPPSNIAQPLKMDLDNLLNKRALSQSDIEFLQISARYLARIRKEKIA